MDLQRISEPDVKAWLHEKRASYGIPNLVLRFEAEPDADIAESCTARMKLDYTAIGQGETFNDAVCDLVAKIEPAEIRAAKLRADAQKLIEQADAIHPTAA